MNHSALKTIQALQQLLGEASFKLYLFTMKFHLRQFVSLNSQLISALNHNFCAGKETIHKWVSAVVTVSAALSRAFLYVPLLCLSLLVCTSF